LEPDRHLSYPSKLRGDKWVRACLKPQLESCVPEEIAFLFETARGSMVYGLYFLPLASLARERCYRVLEAGVRRRCLQLGLLKTKQAKDKYLRDAGFAEILKALTKTGKIPPPDADAWLAIPFLRNRYSHPTSQSISGLEDAVGTLAYTAELLNRLFSP
jgi:hypothetical protein